MKWCDRELIRSPLYIGLCLSEKKFFKELKRMGIKDPGPYLKTPHADATAHFFVDAAGRESVIVTLREGHDATKIEVFGMLVHESVHAWQAIREHIGETAPSSEFEAYSVQMISQNLMVAYEELTKKKKK